MIVDLSPRLWIVNGSTGEVLANRGIWAVTDQPRQNGLLGREAIGSGEALWIVPCAAIHTVGLQFPIDVAFLSLDNAVIFSGTVKPGSMVQMPAAYSALELLAGALANTRRGDRLGSGVYPPNASSGCCWADITWLAVCAR